MRFSLLPFQAYKAAFLSSILLTPLLCAANDSPSIEIIAEPAALMDNVKAHINLTGQPCELSSIDKRSLLKRINAGIIRAAKALGYYKTVFQSDIQANESCWKVYIKLDPGEPVLIEHIELIISDEGKTDKRFNELLEKLPVKPGDQLNHDHYENIKSDLLSLAEKRGYFKSEFTTAALFIDTIRNTANIRLHFNTGPRMRFGETLYPETMLSSDQIKLYNTFKTGEPYDQDLLNKLQNHLNNSLYFTQASVRPRIDAIENNHVPIEITLNPKKQHAFRFGAGIATDTGPRAKFSYENRYLNKKGHKFKYDLSLSPIRSETNLSYILPLSNPATEQLEIYTGVLTEDTDTSHKKINTLGIANPRLLENLWLQTAFLNIQREEFTIANHKNQIDLLMPGISWSKIQTSNPFYPLNGWHLQTRLRGVSNQLGSDVRFIQAYAYGKTINKIGFGRLLTRLELGFTKVSAHHALPASVRFFAGGDNSIRGYGYQSLGPRDENGEVIGGTHLMTVSLEYDIRINQKWAIAGFYDQGNAFNSDDNTKLKRGVGLGLRWLSPIGPIRLDVAQALDEDNSVRIHISMGPDL